MNLKERFQHTFFDETIMTEEDYQKSRNYFIFEGCTATVILTLTTGAFLAGYANLLGADVKYNGIIAAVPSFMGAVQVLSPMVFEKLRRRKLLTSILNGSFRLLLSLMVFIPLLVRGTTARLAMLLGIYALAYGMASFLTPSANNWIASLTPENIRGRYFGKRDSIQIAVATVVSLVMGRVLDIYRDRNAEYSGFVTMFAIIFVLALVNFYFYTRIKEPLSPANKTPLDLKSVLTIPLRNKGFRKIVIMFILFNVGMQVAAPFSSVFMVTNLHLSYTYIMVVTMLMSVVRVVSALFWGRLANRTSWVFTSKLSMIFVVLTHILWAFTNPATAPVMVPVLHLTAGIGISGIYMSLFAVQFQFAPVDGRTIYLGFFSAAGGITGFVSTLAGSAIISLIGDNVLRMPGMTFGGMQAVFALSALLIGISALYTHMKIRVG